MIQFPFGSMTYIIVWGLNGQLHLIRKVSTFDIIKINTFFIASYDAKQKSLCLLPSKGNDQSKSFYITCFLSCTVSFQFSRPQKVSMDFLVQFFIVFKASEVFYGALFMANKVYFHSRTIVILQSNMQLHLFFSKYGNSILYCY